MEFQLSVGLKKPVDIGFNNSRHFEKETLDVYLFLTKIYLKFYAYLLN